MYNLFVIGIAGEIISEKKCELLQNCAHLFATSRLQELASHIPLSVHSISPVAVAVESIKEKLKTSNVAVLASGDPLFYGIGKRLLAEIESESIQFYPALSAIQRAAALCKTHWDDATILSLHGRQHPHCPGLILRHPKTILLTDKDNSPDVLSGQIRNYLQSIDETDLIADIRVWVAEDMDLPTQHLFSGNLAEASRTTFSPLNVMVVQMPVKAPGHFPSSLGLVEEEVIHSRGLITKNEVRAATIHQLRLPEKGVLWDVGGGSGSISIEAARANPKLTIYTIEHKEEEVANIKANIRKFCCYNVIPVFGKAPDSLLTLPKPDRIFVGGSSGTLSAIADIAAQHLPKDGRIVVNGVIAKTIKEAPEQLKRNNFSVETTTIQVNRTDRDNRAVTFNPITITTGVR